MIAGSVIVGRVDVGLTVQTPVLASQPGSVATGMLFCAHQGIGFLNGPPQGAYGVARRGFAHAVARVRVNDVGSNHSLNLFLAKIP